MRILDIITESKNLNEAPMNMLKTVGNKIASKFGNTRAAGRLSTGNIANQLHKDFNYYLGKSGKEADAETVIAFLKSRGYPTSQAEKIAAGQPHDQEPTVGQTAPQGPGQTHNQEPTVGQTEPGQTTKQTPNPTNTTVQEPINYDTPTWKRRGMSAPTLEPVVQQPAAAPTNYDTPTWKRRGMSAPQTTPTTPQPTQEPTNYDTPTWQRRGMSAPQTTEVPKKARGGKVPGQTSMTPNAIRKRNARAQQAGKQLTSDVDYNEMYEAALPNSIIDQMLLAAASEAAATTGLNAPATAGDTSQQQNVQPTEPAQPQNVQPTGSVGGGQTPNTPSSNATFAERLTLKQVQDAALTLSIADQQKLLKFLNNRIGKI